MTEVDWTAANAESLAHLKALIRIPTVNPPGDERPAADYCAAALRAAGIEPTIIEAAPGRTNVIARLPATRPSGRGPLLLSGHLDVVPVERESWTHDPFAAIEADGCVWGRGAIDMKNGVAMSLMTAILLKRTGVELARDVIVCFVADEEAGSHHGALHLVEKHPDLIRAEYVLNEVGGYTMTIGKTRYYPIQVAEKGTCWFELTAKGEPGHGSMPHSDMAIVKLARALERLGAVRLPQHEVPVVAQFLKTIARGAPFPRNVMMPLLLAPALAGHLLDLMGKVDPAQQRGVNAMLRNTVSPTMLRAGHKVNVIPGRATATLDGRMLPGQTVERFLAEIRAVVGDDFEINVIDTHQGTSFPSETPLYEAIGRALERHDPGGVPVPYMLPAFTDSFAYQRLGAICYGFSPVRLEAGVSFTKMFHGHDERIPVEGYHWGQRLMFDLVRDFCAAGGK